eukprot:1672882-Prymnesium_polylepis.2
MRRRVDELRGDAQRAAADGVALELEVERARLARQLQRAAQQRGRGAVGHSRFELPLGDDLAAVEVAHHRGHRDELPAVQVAHQQRRVGLRRGRGSARHLGRREQHGQRRPLDPHAQLDETRRARDRRAAAPHHNLLADSPRLERRHHPRPPILLRAGVEAVELAE